MLTDETNYMPVEKAAIKIALERNFALQPITDIRPLSGLYKKDGYAMNRIGESDTPPCPDFESLFLKDNEGGLFFVATNAQSYVLKLFPENRSLNECALEPRLTRWLANQDFSLVSPAVQTTNNELLCQWNNRNGMLSPYVPSRLNSDWHRADLQTEECWHAGATLARLHAKLAQLDQQTLTGWGLSKSIAPSSVGNDGAVGCSSVLTHLGPWLSAAFSIAEAGRTKLDSASCNQLLAQRQFFQQLIEDSKQTLQNAPDFENKQIVVHGDYHPGNLRWDAIGKKISAIIDFENAHFELPIYDLAYGMLMSSLNWAGLPKAPPANVPRAQAFLQGYRENSSAPDLHQTADFRKLFVAQTNVCLAVILYWLIHSCRSSDKHVDQLMFLITNLKEIEGLSVVY